MRLTRSRISTKHDFEYAIKWENLRTSYFRAHGQPARADQCAKTINELEWRLAMLPVSAEKEASTAVGFVGPEWSTDAEPLTSAGWHHGVKDSVAA